MAAGKVHHLRNFGLGYFVGKHPDHGQTFLVHRQHQFEGLRVVHAKEPFQHQHDKFHGCIVVVQQHDLIQRRLGRLWFGLGQNVRNAIGRIIIVGHHMRGDKGHSHRQFKCGTTDEYKRSLPHEKGGSALLTTICFDADDTLWHNERFFRLTQAHFSALLADFADPETLEKRLLDAERRNIQRYGFGIKGFTLSMIETACQVTDNRVPGHVIAELIAAGQDMLNHPIELLPNVKDVIQTLAPDFKLLVITKGDLLDQDRKLAQSGLGDLFDGAEIVADKTTAVYRDIFSGRGIDPSSAMMVGNSLKSDVNPAIEAGAWGVYVPYGDTWALEAADAPIDHARYHEIDDLKKILKLITRICRNI